MMKEDYVWGILTYIAIFVLGFLSIYFIVKGS